jgi:hypothetical protein
MIALIIGNRRKDRLRRVFRKAALAIGVGLLSLLLVYTAFRRWTLMTAPEDIGPPLPTPRVEVANDVARTTVGESWMEMKDGLWRLHLEGDPRLLGHSHGILAGRILSKIDRLASRLLARWEPSSLQRWVQGNVLRWRYRYLPEAIPAERLVELAAFSRTMVDSEAFVERPFHRLVWYHAAHDITQRMEWTPLLGSTAFAVWGKQTVSGHLLVGRTFDFEEGDLFDREKAVLAFKPIGKVPFVSVAWPGMMGVVTGVNLHRVMVAVNPARTDEPLQPGIPIALLARELLESSTDIKGALEILRRHKVAVPEVFLVADGKVPEAVVVELTPRQMTVRRSSAGVVGGTNHLIDPRFRGDAQNDWVKRYTTSEPRYHRLVQLLSRFSGRIDPKTAALVLRNRTALDDEPLSLGNRNAIDAQIAAHGVVLDLTDMILWVSRGPHLRGAFAAIDLKPIFAMPITSVGQPEPIPADPLHGSPQFTRYHLAEADLRYALSTMGLFPETAMDYARRAAEACPDLPEAHKLLGDLLWERGRFEEAKEHYRRFLEHHPPYLKDREIVKSRLAR